MVNRARERESEWWRDGGGARERVFRRRQIESGRDAGVLCYDHGLGRCVAHSMLGILVKLVKLDFGGGLGRCVTRTPAKPVKMGGIDATGQTGSIVPLPTRSWAGNAPSGDAAGQTDGTCPIAEGTGQAE